MVIGTICGKYSSVLWGAWLFFLSIINTQTNHSQNFSWEWFLNINSLKRWSKWPNIDLDLCKVNYLYLCQKYHQELKICAETNRLLLLNVIIQYEYWTWFSINIFDKFLFDSYEEDCMNSFLFIWGEPQDFIFIHMARAMRFYFIHMGKDTNFHFYL